MSGTQAAVVGVGTFTFLSAISVLSLQKRVDAIEQALARAGVSPADGTIGQIRGQIASLQNDVSALSQELSSTMAALQSLQGQVGLEPFAQQIGQLQSQVGVLQQQVAALLTLIGGEPFAGQIAGLQSAVAGLSQTVGQMVSGLGSLVQILHAVGDDLIAGGTSILHRDHGERLEVLARSLIHAGSLLKSI